ncbi:hypothetical protein F5148DRAFT_4059 [Russula earlei]|uniref:Uncharacterized protein n=1 Tax=Russula earlei TaxID=71964 RepID=A0ACC0UP91_9AGAM|nr:hypothetical protein F5148DRAFT_4059 [Russula earlei]
MIFILAILAATRAFPLDQISPPLVTRDQFQGRSCDNPSGCRSLWDIIWSCSVTLLLCTWVSVHPNIPSPHERWPRIAVRRVGLMFASLFVPEAMIAWALRQRLAARELAKKHEREGWTLTHGFFAIMGGFMEYEGNKPIRVLLPEQLESYSLSGNGNFPRIAKAEIEDKSKGDAISKTLIILQIGWFVTQCIARKAQDLPVTELELITVAFATLNFVMYLLWWDKPLNVQRGVRVYKKRGFEQPIDDPDDEVETSGTDGFWGALQADFSELPAVISLGPFASRRSPDDDSWLTRVFMWPLLKSSLILYGEDEEHEMRVHTFYPGYWAADIDISSLFIMAVALAFGIVHCIGLTFTFPSNMERSVWRSSSVIITVVPIFFTMFSTWIFRSSWDLETRTAFLTVGVGLMAPTYFISRFSLLILPFLALRSLPPAAYHIVHWTSFIPHV